MSRKYFGGRMKMISTRQFRALFGAGAAKSIFAAAGALSFTPNAGLTLSGASGFINAQSSVNGSALISAFSVGGSSLVVAADLVCAGGIREENQCGRQIHTTLSLEIK
jgi:hypothetical protein